MDSGPDTLWKMFTQNLTRNPHHVAVEDGLVCCTYAQLHELVVATSDLLDLEKSRNSFIVSFLPAGLKYIISSLATLSVGKVIVVLHDTYTSTQVEKCLQALKSPLVVTTQNKWDKLDNEFRQNYPNVRFVFENLDPTSMKKGNSKFNEDDTHDNSKLEDENMVEVSYCLFTSGTTGKPKAVLIRDSSVVNGVNALISGDPDDFTSSGRGLMGASISFIPSLADIWTVFSSGGTLVIPPAEIKLDIDRYRTWITSKSITTGFLSTPVMEFLLAKDVEKFTTLRWLAFGGMRINPQKIHLEQANFKVRNIYGATEMFVCTKCELSKESEVTSSAGIPIPGMEVYIVNDEGQKVIDPEVRGNVYVAGDGLMLGYYGQPELTAKVLVPNTFNSARSPMYITGDVGYWGSNGQLLIVGRNDEQVKIHGIRLELGEIETALSTFPAISQAVVMAKEVTPNTPQIFAFCTLVPGEKEPDSKILEDFLLQRLQRHAIPRSIKFLAEFPTTASGKPDRAKLKQSLEESMAVGGESSDRQGTSSAVDSVQASADSDFYRVVRGIWAEVLHLLPNQINFSDNFFYIGGNSVLTFGVMDKLRKIEPKLQNFDPLLLFKAPKLMDFSALLLQRPSENDDIKAIDYQAEIVLPNDIPYAASKSAILITGTTGFLGFLLLLDVLEAYPDVEVFTIIRAKSDADARMRLIKKIDDYSLTSTVKGLDRVTCIAGDLTKMNFGLDSATYWKLVGKVNVIFHSAAEVSFMKTYDQLQNTTVEMTKNILRFAMEGSSKHLHFMSTVGVFDGIQNTSSETYEALEGRIPAEVNPAKMINGYNQSKWVSEQLVWAAAGRGLVASIYRIGQVGAHSPTKIVDRTDAIAGFIITCKRMNCYPRADLRLPFVDGNVSETIISLSKITQMSAESTTRVFHMVGKEVGLEDFFDRGTSLREISLDEWEQEFEKMAHNPKTEDEVNAWLFIQMFKHAEKQVSQNQKSLMRNVTFQVMETVKLAGNNFRNVNTRFYVDLLEP